MTQEIVYQLSFVVVVLLNSNMGGGFPPPFFIMAIVKAQVHRNYDVTYNTPSEVTVGTSNVADSSLGWDTSVDYRYALLQNVGSTNIFLRNDAAATTSVYHTKIIPGTQVELTDTVRSSLNLISSAAGGKVVLTLASPDTSVSVTPAQPSNNINGH